MTTNTQSTSRHFWLANLVAAIGIALAVILSIRWLASFYPTPDSIDNLTSTAGHPIANEYSTLFDSDAINVAPDATGVDSSRSTAAIVHSSTSRTGRAIEPCTQVSDECGDNKLTHDVILVRTEQGWRLANDNEQAALLTVYPASARIPDGVNKECYRNSQFGKLSCDDVQAATAQMLQWHEENEQ